MFLPPGKVPDNPTVNRPKRQFSRFGAFACTVNMIQNPLDFWTRKIRVQNQPGPGGDQIGIPFVVELVAVGSRSSVLPNDCVVNWLTGLSIPNDGRLTLVGDSNRHNIAGAQSCLGDNLVHNMTLCVPDLQSIMFDPTRVRKNLFKLLLGNGMNTTMPVKQNCAGTRRALV